ncbi:AAA family ATPase [Prosthecobacter sp.]|uniref:AAA family ATPase n=1 Tax=Prosthecobacter sp. TaxID=1965333 RepID=UPI0024892BB3|nr:AAA family ATPase [Prosthecobacter sp.]MDI1310893.1 AAA family ATPase [Prosthecobacter sp.]
MIQGNTPVPTADFYVGSVLAPEDLKFRGPFISDLWEALQSHHVLLKAPRRCGKTSVMEHLRHFPQHGYSVIYQNVQDLSHPADFLLAILDNFRDAHPDLFHSLVNGWKSVTAWLPKAEVLDFGEFKMKFREHEQDYREHWRQHGEALFAQLRSLNRPILIIVDELPDMLLNLRQEDPKLLRDFLSWFRDKRCDPAPKRDSVRWLLGGSINISSTLDAMSLLDRINDLEDMPLPELTPLQIESFVTDMFDERRVTYEKEVPVRLRELLGRPIPLFLQMLTLNLYRSWRLQPRKLKVADVEAEFALFITSTAAQDKLQHYYTRLAKYYKEPALSQAHAVLNHLCLADESGASRGTLTNLVDSLVPGGKLLPTHERKRLFLQLMRDLENDFYVTEQQPDRYGFASGIMKAWRRKHYA